MEAVSIVIPVYNREKLVLRCLDSVFAQTWRPLKVYVVDNGSTDGTLGTVLDWAHTRLQGEVGDDFGLRVLAEPKRGACAARNRGLAEVDTRFVIFFDSDDEMVPTLVEEAMRAVGDADIVRWEAEVVNLDGHRWRRRVHLGDMVRRHLYNCELATQVYMARTELVRSVGAWNEQLPVWNDFELGTRLALANPKVVVLRKILTIIYAQAESITGEAFSKKVGEWEVSLDAMEADIAASGREDVAELLDIMDYRRANLAALYLREGAVKEAETLLRSAQARPGRSAWRRWLLRLMCRYTAAGGRGAYYFWHSPAEKRNRK